MNLLYPETSPRTIRPRSTVARPIIRACCGRPTVGSDLVPAALRVAFDARHLQTVARHRGIGRYARNLLAAWQRTPPEGVDFTLLRPRHLPAPGPPTPPPHRGSP